VEISEVAFTDDGRTLIMGMDPTLTLCPVCHEVISPDYVVVNIYPELGRLTHVRCMDDSEYFEEHLLGEISQ
jgi:hypothetical protein